MYFLFIKLPFHYLCYLHFYFIFMKILLKLSFYLEFDIASFCFIIRTDKDFLLLHLFLIIIFSNHQYKVLQFFYDHNKLLLNHFYFQIDKNYKEFLNCFFLCLHRSQSLIFYLPIEAVQKMLDH